MKERKYSMDDLAQAVGEYSYAKAKWEETKHQLNAKRSAIESLERDEAQAKTKVDQTEAVVKRITKDME